MEGPEGERKAGKAVDAGGEREVSVNFCLQFGMEPVNVKSINKFWNALLVSN